MQINRQAPIKPPSKELVCTLQTFVYCVSMHVLQGDEVRDARPQL
jgi:hypothetical protein